MPLPLDSDPPAGARPAWLPPALAELRHRTGPVARVAAAVVAAAVLGAVVAGAVRAGGSPPPLELTLPRAGSPSEPGQAPPGATPAPAAGAAGEAYVHVAGAVVHPGLYRLPGDARVAGALDAAGGPTAEADLDAVNLAARVGDGERLYVPRRGEQAPPLPAGGTGPAGAAGAAAGPLDLNRATAEQLDALPGIGPATAAAVVAHRQENGPFRSVDELVDVRGIGQAKLAAIRTLVTV